ncbi:SMAD/FHA domain-containing protein [Amylocystis lapponica]|nr:SMAD/FHA domain-containing protein [Amylocystis lapponica]
MDPLTIGNESPPARQSILGSFLRSRPRGTSQSHPSPPHDPPATNESPPATIPPSESTPGHRRRAAAPNIQTSLSQSASTPAFSQMLRRRRSAGTLATSTTPQVPVVAVARSAAAGPPSTIAHRIRLVPHLDSRRSLRFDPICRDVRDGDAPLRIGRFTDRSGLGLAAANALGSNKLAFKSKVVSRAHAEIWVEGGRFFIKDTKSSSGTFLNHVRLSAANAESRASELKDGDLLQLGVDYQGGAEDIYKCVKIKIEMGREWQAHSNPFNANALKQLKAIAIAQAPTEKKTISPKSAFQDCCICLFPVTFNQALFVAPCSHAFHYKCLRPLLETHHPAFSCPLCRTFANLDEDVEVEVEFEADNSVDASALASVVAPMERPNTGDGSSRERDRDRDRDAGAETEVEADTGASRIGTRGRRVLPPVPGAGTEDEDEDDDGDAEMEDMVALPPLPEGSPLVLAADMDGDGMREGSVSPLSVPAPVAESSEGEEGTGEAEGGSDASGSAGGGARADAAHGKRKR